MCEYLEVVSEDVWRVKKTGELLRLQKEPNPNIGHTAGEADHNWEELCFRNLRLRWSNVATDYQLCYYCNISTEYTFSIELYDDEKGTKSLVITDVKNIYDASKSSQEVHEENMEPWFKTFLVACGAEPTKEAWSKICKECRFSSFDPTVRY